MAWLAATTWPFSVKVHVVKRELSFNHSALCIHCMQAQFMGDHPCAHPWLGGTTYDAVDSPGGPSMAAIVNPGGPTMATKFAVDGPGGPILGGPPVA